MRIRIQVTKIMRIWIRIRIQIQHWFGISSKINKWLLQGRQLENGLLALIEFLTQARHKLNHSKTPDQLNSGTDILVLPWVVLSFPFHYCSGNISDTNYTVRVVDLAWFFPVPIFENILNQIFQNFLDTTGTSKHKQCSKLDRVRPQLEHAPDPGLLDVGENPRTGNWEAGYGSASAIKWKAWFGSESALKLKFRSFRGLKNGAVEGRGCLQWRRAGDKGRAGPVVQDSHLFDE